MPIDIEQILPQSTLPPYQRSRLLFSWLSQDDARLALYEALNAEQVQAVEFQGRDKVDNEVQGEPPRFQQPVYLLTGRKMVERALKDTESFSNKPYRALGSGTFMLGLDPGAEPDAHAAQQKMIGQALMQTADYLPVLIGAAWEAAEVLPLKSPDFDLAELAEQAAVRFAGFLFGFGYSDHPLLLEATALAYRGLNYQILGRHFVTEPITPVNAQKGMGALFTRAAELIDQYAAAEESDEIKDFQKEIQQGWRRYEELRTGAPVPLGSVPPFKPVLRTLATLGGTLSGSERAVVAAGTLVGIIGNIQAAVCIAVNHFFGNQIRLTEATSAANESPLLPSERLQAMVLEALRIHPPAAFLPRETRKPIETGNFTIPAGSTVVLAIGSATMQGTHGNGQLDPLIFGGTPGNFAHQCIGQQIALPLITYMVYRTMRLPDLSRAKDERTGKVRGLKKLWGFKCESFPMQYARDRQLVQQPLNVIMKVKAPVSEHAEKLKLVIKYGAPRIERKLKESRHVHFSWFVFLENDTKLALFTTYDGNFVSYIEHFALEIGSLFDKLFEHIEDAPPLPVSQFPKEFVQTIRRYNVSPVGGYFFSAYEQENVAQINAGSSAPRHGR